MSRRVVNKTGFVGRSRRPTFVSGGIPESFLNLQPPHREKTSCWSNLLLGLGDQSVALGLDTLRPTLTESLVLGTLSVHLLLEDTLTGALSLGLLDL
jgi:hypothetical protein